MDDVFAIEGGHVLTPEFDVIEADVLVDRETGEVIEVGPDVTAEETLDATDSLVMPGLVNAHTHVAMTLLRGYADDKPLDAWLQEDIWPVEAELTPEDIRVGTELGLVEFIKNGITGFADSYFEVGEIAAATEQSGLRANLCHAFISLGKDDEGARADAQEGLDIARDGPFDDDGTAEGFQIALDRLVRVDHAVSLREDDPLVADELGELGLLREERRRVAIDRCPPPPEGTGAGLHEPEGLHTRRSEVQFINFGSRFRYRRRPPPTA